MKNPPFPLGFNYPKLQNPKASQPAYKEIIHMLLTMTQSSQSISKSFQIIEIRKREFERNDYENSCFEKQQGVSVIYVFEICEKMKLKNML